ALLFRTGIKCENHSTSIILLKEVFGLDNSGISRIKYERVDKEYYVDFQITKDEVSELIGKAEEFNSDISDYIYKA
ncbi:MAG: DNA-binding protein, partial [Candidatus Aenigmarchaeota archaeon]|nr:DNA-binding protein [Candidatus Aenigmarchaeota archaeon]